MPSDNGSFVGKVAFVTGAAAGIGRAAALAFALEGANVVAADVSGQGTQETARLVEQTGVRALAVRCDVSRNEDVKAALEKMIQHYNRPDLGELYDALEAAQPDGLLGLLRRRYMQLNHYSWDLIEVLERRGDVEVLELEPNAIGPNALLPGSIAVWRFR